jgi:GTP cyclohydrolase I
MSDDGQQELPILPRGSDHVMGGGGPHPLDKKPYDGHTIAFGEEREHASEGTFTHKGDERTHYVGDSCEPPHVSADDEDRRHNQAKQFRDAAEKLKLDFAHPFPELIKYAVQNDRLLGIKSFAEQEKQKDLEAAAETLLGGIVPGWTKNNDHSANTPARFVKMLRQLCEPVPEWNFTVFPAETDNMVVLGPIPFYTLCAHHVVPFHGAAFVGYVPDRVVAGLSKFPRAVRAVAKGLHVQETLTTKIADFLEEKLAPKGLAVVLQAEHMCMAMRGVEVAGVTTTTSEMRGVFSEHDRTAKAEFLQWIGPRTA